MINLSTSTASTHAYACRTTGSGMVVGRDVSSRRSTRSLRHTVGTADGVGTDSLMIGTAGGLDMLGQGYANINGFRNNRFQYEIPTVGQHYGNAFHLGEDDEEVADFIIEHHHLTDSDMQSIMEEQIAEEDDDEEDVEMSTAVEVISIDPNCDYDTDEEEEDENDEDVKSENGTDVEKVQDYEVVAEEEVVEKKGNVFTQSRKSEWQMAHFEVVCDEDGSGRYRDGVDVHYEAMKGAVVIGDRSRSRSCSNTESSSSNSSSTSRDSSTSSTYSNANVAESTASAVLANSQPHEQEKVTTMPTQNHPEESYHSDEDICEDAEEEEDETEDEDDDDDDADLDFSPTKNTLWELPAKLLQDTTGPKKPKRQHPGRRKRSSTSQRQSFSMPQSPVGAGKAISSGTVTSVLSTSLSFDDLDSLVCDLSPTKILPIGGRASNNELEGEGDDLLDDQLADPENFDLTAYITGDDSTSCDANSERFTKSESKIPKRAGSDHPSVGQGKPPAQRVLPKSRGKEIKVLRQLMLPQEHQPVPTPNSTLGVKANDVANGKRDSAAKAVRKLALDDEESSEAEDEHIAQRSSQRAENLAELNGNRKCRKRKAADDTDKDPTWNPTGGGGSKSKMEVKQSNHKQTAASAVVASKLASSNQCSNSSSNSSSEEGETSASKPPPTSSLVAKGVKFGPVIKTESSAARLQPVSVAKKSLSNTPPKASTANKTMVRDPQAQTNVHRKKTNVKLDHDYCSPKRGSLMHGTGNGGNMPASLGTAVGAAGQQRKTIEIPFLMPMKEQLKQERKLQKEKKRVDQAVVLPAKRPPPATPSDNGKDKQIQQRGSSGNGKESVSVTNTAQRIASTVIRSLSDGEQSGVLSGVEAKRTDVDKTFVNKNATGRVNNDCGGANDIIHTSLVSVGEAKKFAIPNATGGSGGVKRQISLLKVNQPAAVLAKTADAGIASHVSASAQVKNGDTITVAQTGEADHCRSVEGESVKKETAPTVTDSADVSVEQVTSIKQEVVVRKKLNLQEYKKRREHPASVLQSGAPKANDGNQRSPQMKSDRSNDSLINSASGYSNSTAPPASNALVIPKADPSAGAKPTGTLSAPSSKPTEPLDPISAAKMKALRKQQLLKEAAIKSTEAKLSQKTFPLMPIVPLAQITSLEFDEHGNPLPLNEAKAGQGAGACGQDALKLHPDYEEIIIVSVGCNTALTISPTEMDVRGKDPLDGGGQQQQQHQQQSHNQNGSCLADKEASRLQNISDTIKRCCPSVGTMPGNSLIASIQEVVIKKSNINSSNQAGGNVATAAQTVLVGDEAPAAERATTLKGDTEGGRTHEQQQQQQQQQYLLHQSSPYVGVSPPSSFSPGKPERAHTTNARLKGEYLAHSPSKQSRSSSKTMVGEGKTVHSAAASTQTAIDNTPTAATVVEHGEDKVIMHLRKDRVRTQRVDATTQTEPSGRFPPLCKLAAPPKLQSKHGDSKRREQAKRIAERRSYIRHRHRNGSESQSDADSDATDRPSHRSRSKSSHLQERRRAWDRHSRSRSRSRSRHRSSRRRSSCSSGSRSRSRSGYSSRVHHNHHSTQQQGNGGSGSGNGCNNGGRSYSRSRRKSRTCSRSSSSTSSSRYGSRGRRSLSSSSSCSSMSSYDASDGAMRASRSRSRSPRSRSRSGMRSSTPDRQRYHTRDQPNNRRAISPERNIVYVGRLETNARKEDLQQKFQPYGKIVKVTLHMKANGSRYGFVTFEKPQHAYDAIDARGTDPNLRNYDVSFGGRRAFCRTQYADLDGEVSNDHDHQMPYVTLDGSVLLPARGPLPYSVPVMCHKEPTYGGVGSGGAGESFEDLLKKFKKEICARKT